MTQPTEHAAYRPAESCTDRNRPVTRPPDLGDGKTGGVTYPALPRAQTSTRHSGCQVIGTARGPDAAVQFTPTRKTQAPSKVQKVPQRSRGSHQHSYLISVWPPALRAICTSSFPYLSSAWALQRQSKYCVPSTAVGYGPEICAGPASPIILCWQNVC